MGFDTSDDACVYRITDEIAAIHTVDFFTPIVDDPFWFGQIAAANALSDVYAMGGRPAVAMNLLCVPGCLSQETIQKILEGGHQKAVEAGCVIAGGHTIQDDEPKYGLCVTGYVHPDKALRNVGARPGDALVLTKPLGTGVLTTAAGSVSAHFLPVLCFLPIGLYNGERGRLHPKWLFYLYYPLHLSAFYLMIYIGALL